MDVHTPEAPTYDQQIAGFAEAWRRFAERHSGMRPETVAELAIRAACFTLRHRCNDLAIPLKLDATTRHQDSLWKVCNRQLAFGTRLATILGGMAIQVGHLDDTIGLIPPEHVSWMRPLLSRGADLRLVQVLNCQTDDSPLEAVVMTTRVGKALGLRSDNEPVVNEALCGDPILLWRSEDGSAQTNVRGTVRESVQGHDWGYSGSGPAELSLAILEEFVSEEEAWKLHGAFKDQVLEPMPWEGGELSREEVLSWIEREKQVRVCC